MDDSSVSGSIRDRPPSERNEVDEVEKLTSKDNRRVSLLHKIVTAMMVIAAIFISTTAYKILVHENNDDYKTAYDLFAESVRDSAALNIRAVVNAAKTFSATTSSYAKAMNSTWPFVTVPNFEVQVANVKKSTRAERVLLLPLVEAEDYDEWNEYCKANIGWRKESLEAYGKTENFSEPIASMYTLSAGVYGAANESRPDGPYLPYWQSSPPVDRAAINRDTLTFSTNIKYGNSMEASRECIFGNMFPVDYYVGEDKDLSFEDHDALHASFTTYAPKDTDRDYGWATDVPHSTFVCPIFETENDRFSKIVGRYSYILPWDAFLTNLLPRGSNDMVAVLTNSGNQSATFILRGNNAVFIGWEDLHDTKYDPMALSFDVTALAGINKKVFDIVEDSGAIFYNATIYPTSGFEDAYRNSIPAVFTTIIVVAFFFMILTFFTYDYVVYRRNRKVVHTAAKSNAIVTSLFPSTVRDRLYEEESGKKEQEGTRFVMNRFLKNEDFGVNDNDEPQTDSSKPIADSFPETTIMFADIVGFTSWSSGRDPVAVFTLLEAIYNAFDRVAKRRGVFKVETIGDCYLAVCGLPNPRKDHAVVMARFASKCCEMLPIITRRLESTLGTDTGDLKMRIGLHSGSVTAGVLRGERSRFQLFGDSVNVAARMESTGVPGKIQMSEATVELLREAGKMCWCHEREETVHAKGKGSMKTYFLVKGGPSTESSMGFSNGAPSSEDEDHESSYRGVDDEDLEAMGDLTEASQMTC